MRRAQDGRGATENGKAAAGELVAALEIEDVEVGAQVPVRLKSKSNSRGVPQRRRSMFSSSSLPYGVASQGMLEGEP